MVYLATFRWFRLIIIFLIIDPMYISYRYHYYLYVYHRPQQAKIIKKCNIEQLYVLLASKAKIHFVKKFLSSPSGPLSEEPEKYQRKERACLLRAVMPQAVLQGNKNGRRTTKILMDDFFSIPLLLAKKNFFSDPPCWCCLTGGRGQSAFWGVSDVG